MRNEFKRFWLGGKFCKSSSFRKGFSTREYDSGSKQNVWPWLYRPSGRFKRGWHIFRGFIWNSPRHYEGLNIPLHPQWPDFYSSRSNLWRSMREEYLRERKTRKCIIRSIIGDEFCFQGFSSEETWSRGFGSREHKRISSTFKNRRRAEGIECGSLDEFKRERSRKRYYIIRRYRYNRKLLKNI